MSKVLDPKVMMAIKDLALAAKTTIDGFMTGLNKSYVKGPGLEFSQYRTYQPGDDLRWLDWKMYARSDRYYIRESEIETSISVKFLIDASASMNHEDQGFKKIDYARYLAAALAYLASLQGDAVGLYVLQDGGLFALPARQSYQHLNRLYFQLGNIVPGGKFTEPLHYKEIFAGAQRKELLLVITDYYEQDGEITRLLDQLSNLKHEIVVFQVMAPNELLLDYKDYTSFEDLETGERIQVDTAQVQKAYTARLNDHMQHIRTQLLDKKIYYRLMNMNDPLEEALRDFLNQRNKART